MSVRRWVAALGAMVLVAGCGGDPKPNVEATPSSPSTSPTQSETAKPASAEAVIRQYVRLSLDAQAKGETSSLRDAFPVCKSCLRMADHIDTIYSGGGFIHPGKWTIRRIELAGHVGSRYEYDLSIVAKPGRYKEDGKITALTGGPNTFRMIFRKSDGWSLTDVQDET
jgi:hypothetical protein